MVHLAIVTAALLFLACIAIVVLMLIAAGVEELWRQFQLSCDASRESSTRLMPNGQTPEEYVRQARREHFRAEIVRHTLPTHKGKPIIPVDSGH